MLYIIIYYNSIAPTWRWWIENERPTLKKKKQMGRREKEKINARPARIPTKNDYYFHNCNSKDKWYGTCKLTNSLIYMQGGIHISDNSRLFFSERKISNVWFELVFGFLDVLISLFFLSLELFELKTWIKLAKGHCMPHSKQSY